MSLGLSYYSNCVLSKNRSILAYILLIMDKVIILAPRIYKRKKIWIF